jgi:hypothetical protein
MINKKRCIRPEVNDHEPADYDFDLAAYSTTFAANNLMAQMDTSAMAQDPALQRKAKMEPEDRSRGRRKSRPDNSKTHEGSGGDVSPIEDEAADEHSSGSDGGPSRKRRRSRKGLDKKFECPTEGCGKSYSRAEHL